jgi:hypothetical protein
MQATHDILGIWKTWTALAVDISAKPDTVRKWKKFHRIPQESWQSIIDAAARKRRRVTVEQIMEFNAPMKPRGRPPRLEERAS